MSETSMTMTYARPRGDLVITLKGQDYGSDEVWSRRQVVGETMGDQVYVYDLGPDKLELNLQLNNLDTTERGDLEQFLRTIQFAKRYFTISLPAPTKAFPIRAGATVSGVSVKAGGFTAGQYLVQDVLTYKVQLVEPSLSWVESLDVHYSATMSLRVLFGYVPDNNVV